MKQLIYKGIAPFSIAFLVGCGGTNHTTTNESTIHKAYYIDSTVQGVTYHCGNQKGKTNKEGMFLFETGKGCIFSVGNINFKTIDADLLTEGAVIKENNISIAKFLLSFDWDGNATNGIEIKPEIDTLLSEKGISSFPLTEAQYTTLIEALHHNYPASKSHLYSDSEVHAHLAENHPPLIVASIAPTNVMEGETIHFDATQSSDPDGDALTYQWLENDQVLSTQATFDTNILAIGSHTITLKITDTAGHTQQKSFTVTVVTPSNKKPIADAGDDITIMYRKIFTLDASKSKDPDGKIVKYTWMYNDEVVYSGNKSKYPREASQPTGYYFMNLIVTDDANATATDQIKIHITPAHNTAVGLEQTDVNDDEIIIDNNTGLMWVNDNRDDINTTYKISVNKGCYIVYDVENFVQKAKDFCANLSYAGYNDWRVSTPEEISNFSKYWDQNTSKPNTVPQSLRHAGMVPGYTHKNCKKMIGIDENDVPKTVYTENTPDVGVISSTIHHLAGGMRCVREIR